MAANDWQHDIASAITSLEDYRTHHLQADLTVSNQPVGTAQQQAVARIAKNFLQYQNINRQLSDIIRRSTPPDLGSTLSKIGQDQQKIEQLKKEIAQARLDLETAEQRNAQVEHPQIPVSEYQGLTSSFGITKPFHMISISILIGVSFFLFIVSVLIFKDNFLTGLLYSSGAGMASAGIMGFLRDPRVWATLFGAACITILFLSLKIANKLPLSAGSR